MTLSPNQSVRILYLILIIILSLLMSRTARADNNWQLRANFLAIDDGEYDGIFDLIDAQVFTSIGHDNSFGLSIERRLNDRLGLELSAFTTTPELGLIILDAASGQRRGGSDSLDIFTMTLGLAFHLTPNRNVDVYVEPMVGMMNVEDLNITDSGGTLNLEVDDEVVIGLALGIDVPIKDSAWSFNANLRYLDLGFEPTAEDGASIHIDFEPIVAGLGVGFRF